MFPARTLPPRPTVERAKKYRRKVDTLFEDKAPYDHVVSSRDPAGGIGQPLTAVWPSHHMMQRKRCKISTSTYHTADGLHETLHATNRKKKEKRRRQWRWRDRTPPAYCDGSLIGHQSRCFVVLLNDAPLVKRVLP